MMKSKTNNPTQHILGTKARKKRRKKTQKTDVLTHTHTHKQKELAAVLSPVLLCFGQVLTWSATRRYHIYICMWTRTLPPPHFYSSAATVFVFFSLFSLPLSCSCFACLDGRPSCCSLCWYLVQTRLTHTSPCGFKYMYVAFYPMNLFAFPLLFFAFPPLPHSPPPPY